MERGAFAEKTAGQVRYLYKANHPYKSSGANALQNLTLWIPSASPVGSAASTPTDYLPPRPGPWVIYIHGGAWRDPLVDAATFEPTVQHLLARHAPTFAHLGGIASLNYTLSPHPKHPTHPSSPDDPSRNAAHPDHVRDVLTGLAFLQRSFGFGANYVLAGHSCGATLAFQVAMDHARWIGAEAAAALAVEKPRAVLGLDGLYDMPVIIKDPGPKHEALTGVYDSFTRGAFGDDEAAWHAISPVSVENWKAEWKEGERAVLAQSKEDSLVPYEQTTKMKAMLTLSRGLGLHIREMECGGDHNELWQKGDRLAEIVADVVEEILSPAQHL
ncbi:Alpha/Beta hydrolase protein [Phyllosticta citriasiana]|uniref:Alpha/Beta hydrolase protein n=1 Tax=Phyllosticta citriasiana TaxID=595635 RepID=UPI0030FDF28C